MMLETDNLKLTPCNAVRVIFILAALQFLLVWALW